MDKWRIEHDQMKTNMDVKNEEIGVLRAKLNLDLIEYKVQLVAEYPDMVEDNNHLHAQVEHLNTQIDNYKKIEHELKEECKKLNEEGKEKDRKIKQLEREKEIL